MVNHICEPISSNQFASCSSARVGQGGDGAPLTVYRRWMCEQVGCDGELVSTGEGITRLSTRWKHRCGKCGHEDWADTTYPRVAYLPFDVIGPEDSYT